MFTICKNTGSVVIEPEERGGFYVKQYNSRPPVEKCGCGCGRKFNDDTDKHLYVTGSCVYQHICLRKECLERLVRIYARHYREFFVNWHR